MEKDPLVKEAKLHLYNGDCITQSGGCPSIQAPLLRTWNIENLGKCLIYLICILVCNYDFCVKVVKKGGGG